MEKELNGRVIRKVCKICSLKHGNIKEPTDAPEWQDGLCDVCEATGNTDIPQSVAPVTDFGGVNSELLPFISHSPST